MSRRLVIRLFLLWKNIFRINLTSFFLDTLNSLRHKEKEIVIFGLEILSYCFLSLLGKSTPYIKLNKVGGSPFVIPVHSCNINKVLDLCKSFEKNLTWQGNYELNDWLWSFRKLSPGLPYLIRVACQYNFTFLSHVPCGSFWLFLQLVFISFHFLPTFWLTFPLSVFLQLI